MNERLICPYGILLYFCDVVYTIVAIMTIHKKIILVLLLTLGGIVNAQELKVLEFRADLTMTDALQYPKEDFNGDRCGLLKLGLVFPDATFEGDIIFSEYKDGEWWIYMPKGSNWLTIKSKSHVPLRCEFSDYGIKGIQSNVTYVMTVVEITGSGGNHSSFSGKIYPKKHRFRPFCVKTMFFASGT